DWLNPSFMKILNLFIKTIFLLIFFWLIINYGYWDVTFFRYLFFFLISALFFVTYDNNLNGFYTFIFLSLVSSTLPKLFNSSINFSINIFLFLSFLGGYGLSKSKIDFKKAYNEYFVLFIFCSFYIVSFLLTFLNDFYFPSIIPGFSLDRIINNIGEGYPFIINHLSDAVLNGIMGYIIIYFINKEKVNKNTFVKILLIGILFNFIAGILQVKDILQKSWGVMELSVKRYNALFVDPNSLGIGVLICFSIFLSYLINFAKDKKYLLIYLAGLIISVYLIIISVSRSSLIGCVIFLLFLVVLQFKNKFGAFSKKYKTFTYLRIILVFIIIVYVSFTYFDFIKNSNFGIRVNKIITNIERGNIVGIIDSRAVLWTNVLKIAKDNISSGLGLGGFYVFVVNYTNQVRDSAGSLYFEYLCNFGIFGTMFLLFFFYRLFILSIRYMKMFPGENKVEIATPYRARNDDIEQGFILLFWTMLIIFNFGAHIYFTEVNILFFSVVGFIIKDMKDKNINFFILTKIEKKILVSLFVLYVLFSGIKIYKTRNYEFLMKYNDKLNFNLSERLEGQFYYTWTDSKVAVMKISPENNEFVLPLMVANPDIKTNPVKVKVYVSDKLIDEISYNSSYWDYRKYTLTNEELKKENIFLKVAVNKTFNPKKMNISADSRDLGIAIGDINWNNRPGFYYKERWNNSFYYWFTMKEAILKQKIRGNYFSLPIMLPHNDIKINPVKIFIYLNDRLLEEITYDKNFWDKRKYKLNEEDLKNNFVNIKFQVSRVFNPKKSSINTDDRDLGVAIGETEWSKE
ncbi:MAG: O-antigen ligase family protein, partial [Patescibacteria group bacterium]